jgi:hypothetical protein
MAKCNCSIEHPERPLKGHEAPSLSASKPFPRGNYCVYGNANAKGRTTATLALSH